MSVNISQPQIRGGDPRQTLQEMQSYLYQLSGQLNWAFSTLETHQNQAIAQLQVQSGSGATHDVSTGGGGVNFNDLRDLIIKNADIVDSLYVEVSQRLRNIYIAQSEFGTYMEDQGLDIVQNAYGTTQEFNNIRQICLGDTGFVKTTSAYIKTGFLNDYDGNQNPIYGVEVGQTNDDNNSFKRSARFTSDGVYFYDNNGIQVAYVTNQKLYISDAQINGKMSLANMFDIYEYQGQLIFRYTGEE